VRERSSKEVYEVVLNDPKPSVSLIIPRGQRRDRLEEKRQREAERQAKEEAERLAREQEEAKWKPRPFKL
jgi:hypothetical protein